MIIDWYGIVIRYVVGNVLNTLLLNHQYLSYFIIYDVLKEHMSYLHHLNDNYSKRVTSYSSII